MPDKFQKIVFAEALAMLTRKRWSLDAEASAKRLLSLAGCHYYNEATRRLRF